MAGSWNQIATGIAHKSFGVSKDTINYRGTKLDSRTKPLISI